MSASYRARTDLKAKRIAVSLKRRPLAELVGCSYTHIANAESGHNTLSPELEAAINRVIARKAKELGVDLSEVVNGEEAAERADGAHATPGSAATRTATSTHKANEEVRGAA